MRAWTIVVAAAVALCAGGAANAAPVPSEARAVAVVSAVVREHARACRLSFDGARAVAIADGVVPSVTVGWRVEARVRRFGLARLRTLAVWRVDARGARPDSPLAGQLAIGCARVDPGAPTTPEAWHSLPYLDEDGSFYLTGNEAWAGSVASVPTGRSELSLASYPWGERFRFVWGTACTAARQEVRLRRTLFLPGRPASVTASLTSLALRPGRPAANPVRSLRLLVNGGVALAVRGSGGPATTLPPAALALFADGLNRVELVATKRRSRPCNAGPRSLQVGIAFELTGRFLSALAIGRAGLRVPGFHREGATFFGRTARTTFGRDGSLRFAIRNDGPSAAPGATFSLELTGSAHVAFLARTLSRNVRSCATSDATSDLTRPPPYRLVCVLTELAAGTTLPLELRYRFGAAGPFSERRLHLAWTLESPQARAPARGLATLVFCGAHAASAGCARAP